MDIESHPERVSNLREFADNYFWSELEFPVSIKDIGKFEIKNNVSVNVLSLEGKDISTFSGEVARVIRTHKSPGVAAGPIEKLIC